MSKMIKFNWKKGVAAIICSLFLTIGLFMLLAWTLSPFIGKYTYDKGWDYSPIGAFGVVLLSFIGFLGVTYLLYNSENIKKLIGKGFIILALEFFALPVVMLIFTIGSATLGTKSTLGAIGSVIGGGIVTLIAAVIGLFLGIIFLIIGYFMLKH